MPDRRALLTGTAGLLAAGLTQARAQTAAQPRLEASTCSSPPGRAAAGTGSAGPSSRWRGRPGWWRISIENVGGAGGTVGLPRFVSQRRGRPDALMVAGSIMVGATLTNRTPVGIKDVTPIARLTEEAGVVVVPASSDIRDLKGLLDALRANPGAVAVAGGSAGGTDHITLGLILKSLGRSAKEGSYVAFAGGGPAQAAILGAQVKAGISGLSNSPSRSRLAACGRWRPPARPVPTPPSRH
ncbi:Bug family tripartite tricarboxylate transporter substrate binding protein [Siccirubricoccus deserti]